MRFLPILAILAMAACTPTVTVSDPDPSVAGSPAFLTCPGKPGQQYRPGFENATCSD
jgi:hypothetical protein